ncbi:hypothetical protein BDZ88DRAFT_211449 [Geranomyces variabilis]|nr:hypothetical protein BDZ88DRAFT_211449 [Geranomyces variabilis]KAJ3133022.1 hypothetical protein HDU90_006558 [Geranomyces variabilis]
MPSKKAKKSSKPSASAPPPDFSSPPALSSHADAAVDNGLKLGRRDGAGPRANALLARRIQFLELPAAPVQPRQAGSLRRITPGKAVSEVVLASAKKVDGETTVEQVKAGKGAHAPSKPGATAVPVQRPDTSVPAKAGGANSAPLPATGSVPLSKKRKAEPTSALAEQELGVVISRKKAAGMVAKKPATTTAEADEDQQIPVAVAASASVPLPEIPAPGPKPKTVRPKAPEPVEERPVIATPKPRAPPRPRAATTTSAADQQQHAMEPGATSDEPAQQQPPPPAFAGQYDLERPPPTNANHIPLIPRAARANNNGPTLPTHNDPQIGVPVAQWTDDLATHATNVQRARLLHMHKPQIRRADDWDKDYDRGYEKKKKVRDGEAKPRRGRR